MYDMHGVTLDADPTASFSFDGDNHNVNFTHPSHTARADETLSGVLLGVFLDFMEGDFQMLRTFLREFMSSLFSYPSCCSVFIVPSIRDSVALFLFLFSSRLFVSHANTTGEAARLLI